MVTQVPKEFCPTNQQKGGHPSCRTCHFDARGGGSYRTASVGQPSHPPFAMLQQQLLAAALNGLALETVEMGSQPDAAAQSKPHEFPRAHLAGAGRRRDGVQLTYAVPALDRRHARFDALPCANSHPTLPRLEAALNRGRRRLRRPSLQLLRRTGSS